MPLVAGLTTSSVIACGFGFCVAVNLPGHLSYDSVIQLLEGRTGVYNGWHPPVMSWLLGLADSAQAGTALYLVLVAAVFFGALASLVWLPERRSWLAAAAAAACVLSPQLLIYQGTVWKDVLFANAAIGGFVALAHSSGRWNCAAWRCGLLTLATGLFVIAALARQNGPILLPFAAAALASIVYCRGSTAMRAASSGATSLAIALALCFGAQALLATRIKGEPGRIRMVKMLEAYDLVAALAAEPKLQLTELQQRDPSLLILMQTDGRRLYSPERNDTLTHSAPLLRAILGAPTDALRAQWFSLIAQNAPLYLRDRTSIFRWVFFTPDISVCVPVYLGIDGPPKALERLRIAPRFDRRDEILQSYGQWFTKTPFFSHAFFLLMATGELLFLFWRRRTSDLAIGMMLAGAAAFTSTFFVVSLACDYRYLYFLDLAAMTGLFYIALDPRASYNPQRPNG